jgi:sporulation protein YlmC with PRC-barrel domain
MKKIPIVAVSILSAALASTSYATDVQEKQKEIIEQQQEVKETQHELVQENRKEFVKNTEKSNKVMQQVSRASKIIGAHVSNPNGDSLGKIKELMVDPESGQVVYAVVSFGGILGMGNKLFAIPWQALHWVRDKHQYILNMDEAVLKDAPGFDKKHWPDSSNRWDQLNEELNQFYHITP